MNQDKENSANNNPEHFSPREIFEIALKSRDFEIRMFWQRCNYFLLLNTSVGVAVGVAATSKIIPMYLNIIIPFLCAIGAFVCLAWIKVGLGSKFWQVYWEQVVVDFQKEVGLTPSENPEKKPSDDKDIFSQPKHTNRIKERVRRSLHNEDESDSLYNWCVLKKPSVSRWMHNTALFFFLVWFLAFLYTFFCIWLRVSFCCIFN